MTEDRMALVELLQKSGEADFLRGVAESVLQILMETDVEGLIGAGRHERTGDRLNYRNGIVSAASTHASARSSCASRSCGKARISRHSSSRARLPRRHWSQ